jgi:hypothetical protein
MWLLGQELQGNEVDDDVREQITSVLIFVRQLAIGRGIIKAVDAMITNDIQDLDRVICDTIDSVIKDNSS